MSYGRHTINHLCGLGKISDGAKLKILKTNLAYQEILEVLTGGKGEWKGSRKRFNDSIAIGYLVEEAKVWFYFLSLVLMPSKHVCTVRQEETILFYAILKGYKIIFGKILKNSILGYENNKFYGHMPHPSIITHLCLKEGVTFDKDEEEKCLVVPHLTLTIITKNPTNNGKKKLNEADRPKTRCVKCTPMCASARVAPSNIVYSWYGYRSTGTGVLTTKVQLFR